MGHLEVNELSGVLGRWPGHEVFGTRIPMDDHLGIFAVHAVFCLNQLDSRAGPSAPQMFMNAAKGNGGPGGSRDWVGSRVDDHPCKAPRVRARLSKPCEAS